MERAGRKRGLRRAHRPMWYLEPKWLRCFTSPPLARLRGARPGSDTSFEPIVSQATHHPSVLNRDCNVGAPAWPSPEWTTSIRRHSDIYGAPRAAAGSFSRLGSALGKFSEDPGPRTRGATNARPWPTSEAAGPAALGLGWFEGVWPFPTHASWKIPRHRSRGQSGLLTPEKCGGTGWNARAEKEGCAERIARCGTLSPPKRERATRSTCPTRVY